MKTSIARALSALTAGLSIAAWSAPAGAQGTPQKTVPASGGLDALDVKVDLEAGVVRTKKGAATKETPIGIDRSRIDPKDVVIDVIGVGQGRSVAHVRIPDAQRKDLAFELLASGQSEAPIFAGLTGYTKGAEGDRSGNVVLVKEQNGAKFVLVAETREDTRICGQSSTLIGAQGISPATMTLVGATLPRIDAKARASAVPIVAAARPTTASPPLGRVFTATGGSAPGSAALTDGKVDSAWSETRSGDGHGEFVTMRVPTELPLHAIVVTVAPTAPKPTGAAPRTFFLAVDDQLFAVTMPENAWAFPARSYEIPLPKPVKTSCIALVLDEAYAQTDGARNPEVTVAELGALTKFDVDGAKLTDVAKALGTARGDEASALLQRAGDEGLAATAGELASLDPRGRARAVDVAAGAGVCNGPAMDLLVRALTDREAEVKRKALGRIERCGKAAGESLAAAVRAEDEATRAAAAPLLATVAPSVAIEPLAEQMGRGSSETRRAVRGAFSRAAGNATRDKLLGLLTKKELTPIARLDLLRATGAKLTELRPESDRALATILESSPDMATRYLLAQPLAHLARAQDATSGELTRLAELVRRDPDWPVRAHAVELSAGIGPLVPAMIAAASDPEPRVREAALKALAKTGQPAAIPAAVDVLSRDDWTFVRLAAAEALGALPASDPSTASLAAALADASPRVRVAALAAFGNHRAVRQAEKIRERLDDVKEDPDVRAAAARTLGALCVQNASDRLTKLALLSRAPVDEADERVGMAAIEALGALHPTDLEQRLAPLRAKEVRMPVRRAAERALHEPSACR
ncbi:MAG: HEAT repeat domain-containing protein [Deltaproteobacteria bacterium]|nr:HEAT repeat domain-containing protein [Deltaproteobacteria bacterium]